MSRIAYVNGRYAPHAQAAVSVDDRGYLFADGVYEVCEIFNGALIDMPRHLDRLERSLAELRIAMPVSRAALAGILAEVARRNRVRNGMVYFQVTRGAAPRDHSFPKGRVKPALIVTAKSLDRAAGEARAALGVAVVTMPDIRWKRVDIKTIGLTANVLARQAAREAGAFEAWLVDEAGMVREGAATNAWIVTREGVVVTPPADGLILAGVTRATVIDICRAEGLPVEERRFTVAQGQGAAEAFCTGATLLVTPVVSLDGTSIGNGRAGPVAMRLRARFHDFAHATPIDAGHASSKG